MKRINRPRSLKQYLPVHKAYHFKIITSNFDNLVVCIFGTKEEAYKRVADWIKSEKNLQGAKFEEV